MWVTQPKRPKDEVKRPEGPPPSSILINASEILVAPQISECFGLPWSALDAAAGLAP